MEIRFLFLKGTQGLPPKGETSPLGGWHGHLLVTPSFHHAVQKTNEWIEILETLEVRKIFQPYDSKAEKHVKEIIEISPHLLNPQFYSINKEGTT